MMTRVTVLAGHWMVSFQPSSLGAGGWRGCSKAHFFGGHVLECVEGAAVEDLEAHKMEVHGVRVFCLVDELPDLGGVEFWKLGGGLVPAFVVESMTMGFWRRS